MLTCTWAPTTFAGTQVVRKDLPALTAPKGKQLTSLVSNYVKRLEVLNLTHLLIAQRWWGNANEIEGSSLDCLAMTSFIAAHTESLNLVTAVHPGFFEPTAIAKWGATLDHLTMGRWSINVTSGWNLEEFSMYGIDALTHDDRYRRSSEFIDVLRGAWENEQFNHAGEFYQVRDLVMEPRPTSKLMVFQGGQSDAAIDMACRQSDWMFLNGGSLEKTSATIEKVRAVAEKIGRCPKFALYGIPVCRKTDAQASEVIDDMIRRIDPKVLEQRKARVSGAEGMWSQADNISMLDTNEGYATGLIGSPDTIFQRIEALQSAGVEMLHLALGDSLFETEVLPRIHGL